MHQLEQLPPEIEEGNIEYKLHLSNPTPDRFDHLVSQMKWRLAEGFGEAIYDIGVSDNGSLVGLNDTDLKDSLATLKRMAKELGADISVIREHIVDGAIDDIVELKSDVGLDKKDVNGLIARKSREEYLLECARKHTGKGVRKVAEVLVRRGLDSETHFLEIRVAIIGLHACLFHYSRWRRCWQINFPRRALDERAR